MSICDHKSVGMLVKKDGALLLIERKKFPFGFAPPAGHIDGDPSFEITARRELEEEVGLRAENLTLLTEGRKENVCRREDGSWHYWKIYQVTATGDLHASPTETKQCGWYTQTELEALAHKTKKYIAHAISEEDWQKNPGLEPVWLEWLTELKMINQ